MFELAISGYWYRMLTVMTFSQATKKTRISDFRFNDQRHACVSWHVQNGTPLVMLKEMGGWQTLEMVKKYTSLGAEHLNKFVGSVTFLAHENELDMRGELKNAASH